MIEVEFNETRRQLFCVFHLSGKSISIPISWKDGWKMVFSLSRGGLAFEVSEGEFARLLSAWAGFEIREEKNGG